VRARRELRGGPGCRHPADLAAGGPPAAADGRGLRHRAVRRRGALRAAAGRDGPHPYGETAGPMAVLLLGSILFMPLVVPFLLRDVSVDGWAVAQLLLGTMLSPMIA